MEMNCELCQGELMLLGVLGNKAHFRCRHCGAVCSQEITEMEPETVEVVHSAGVEVVHEV